MKKPELIIMYTWDINGYYDNKICGHTIYNDYKTN